MSSLDTDDLKQIARCPHLGAVEHLDLGYNPFNAAGLRAIAPKRLPALTSLVLRAGSWIGLDGVRELVHSPLAGRLEHLVLAWQQLGAEGVKIVTEAPRLKRLRTLDLSDNGITDAGARCWPLRLTSRGWSGSSCAGTARRWQGRASD